MVHEAQPTIGQKIWAGDYGGAEGAFEDSRKAYRANPPSPASRTPWASALYSELVRRLVEAKRGNIASALRVLYLAWLLWPQMRFFKKHCNGKNDFYLQMSADGCETVSAIMNRWRKIPFLGIGYTYAMTCYVHRAYAADVSLGSPTHANAALTRADLERGHAGYQLLREAVDGAPDIENPNQRSRVYRDAALLHLEYDEPTIALELIQKARIIPSLDGDVVFKNQAAFERIKRDA